VSIQDALKAGHFKTNPFRIVPPADMDNIHWAGDRTVIDDLLEAAHSPRHDALGTSELVVLFGDFGAGKTNALIKRARSSPISRRHRLQTNLLGTTSRGASSVKHSVRPTSQRGCRPCGSTSRTKRRTELESSSALKRAISIS